MISPILARTGTESATLERWNPIAGALTPSPVSTEANARVVMPDSGTLSNFYLRRNSAPGAGTSVTYTLVKNGTNTAVTCTLSDTNVTTQDSTNSVSYVAGDTFSVDILPTGTVAATGTTWSIDNNSTGQALLMSESTNLAAGTFYGALQNGNWTAGSTDIQQLIPTAGTIDSAYMNLSTTTGSGKTWTATLVKNGSDTTLVVAITNGTANSDTTHSVSVTAGDTAYWRLDATNTPASSRVRVGARFTPTTDGESIQMGSSSANLATSGNNFIGVQGGATAYSTTEGGARADYLGTVYDLKKLYASVDTANALATWTFTVRSNSANTTVTCAITGVGVTTNNDTTHTATATAPAYLAVNIVGTTTPTACPAQVGYVTYRAPVATTITGGNLTLMGIG